MSDWVTLKNALGLTLRPIDAWPGKVRYDREAGPFSAPVKDTQATLKREMMALNAKNVVLQIAFRETDFRQDGLPYANAVATHPGVILAFDSKHGPLRLFFDRFTKWQNNLRAIAMHLEHLRLAGLYGVGTDGQQYKGWQALPPPPAPASDRVADAAKFIARHGGGTASEVLTSAERLAQSYRNAANSLHPDRQPHSECDRFTKMFQQLQTAKELLDKHHKEGG